MPIVGQRAQEETHYPVELLQCENCALAQLSCIVDPSVIFHPDYPYSSGNTQALRENFLDLADEIRHMVHLQVGDLVVDIGSNDGTLLEAIGKEPGGNFILGIEPTNQAKTAKAKGIATIQKPFTAALAATIDPKANVITACNVMAHIADVHDALDGVAALLSDDGIFVTENHYLGALIEGLQWDCIYHEHLRYYSLKSLSILLEFHGLHIFRAEMIASHGGSFRVFASKEQRSLELIGTGWMEEPDIAEFAAQVAESKRAILKKLGQSPGRIVAVGAAARGAMLLHYCGIDVDRIEAVAEVKGSDKIGHYMPGSRIPVVDEATIWQDPPENLLLLPWHLADSLMPKFRAKGFHGNFILPLPAPEVISETVEAVKVYAG